MSNTQAEVPPSLNGGGTPTAEPAAKETYTHAFGCKDVDDKGTVRAVDVRRVSDGSFEFRWKTTWAGNVESTESAVRLSKRGMEMLSEMLMTANWRLDEFAIPPKTDTGTAVKPGVQDK